MGFPFLFKPKGNDRLATYLQENAIILDVRSKQEFSMGHASGSRNVPLDQLNQFIKKNRGKGSRYITCCASGIRSGKAASKLTDHGIDAINGGPWKKVQAAIENRSK